MEEGGGDFTVCNRSSHGGGHSKRRSDFNKIVQ